MNEGLNTVIMSLVHFISLYLFACLQKDVLQSNFVTIYEATDFIDIYKYFLNVNPIQHKGRGGGTLGSGAFIVDT